MPYKCEEKQRDYINDLVQRNKVKAKKYLGGKCSRCGSVEDLFVMNRAKLEGGGHGWAENEANDMVIFNPQEAEKRINEAIKDKGLGSGQFNSVVMGILKGLENHLGCEVLLEFDRNIYKGCYGMSVKPRGKSELFKVEFANGQVLDIQRK